MSDADGRVLPALDTFPGLVLTLTALSGELPAALVSRLPASDTYKEYAVKQLKRDNLSLRQYRDQSAQIGNYPPSASAPDGRGDGNDVQC